MKRLKVGFYGTGPQMKRYFLPAGKVLGDRIEMVFAGGRDAEKVRAIGQEYDLPSYTDVETMVGKHQPDFVCAVVSCAANHEVAEKFARLGVSTILETPIEVDLHKGRDLIALARRHGVHIEIAENSYRFPVRRLVKKLLDTGRFGPVRFAYSDLCAHGYHGMNVLRSYAGFDAHPVAVVALHAPPDGDDTNRDGGVRMGLVQLDNGVLGIHSMSYGRSLAARPPAREFVAANGWMSQRGGELLEGGRAKPVVLERTERTIDGVQVCQKMTALIDGTEAIEWVNPLADKPFTDAALSTAWVIQSMADAVAGDGTPEYRLEDALLDYEIDSAMCSSHATGRRVTFPLDYEMIARERAQGLY